MKKKTKKKTETKPEKDHKEDISFEEAVKRLLETPPLKKPRTQKAK